MTKLQTYLPLCLNRRHRIAILHLLGLDHEKLNCRHAGRDYRRTKVDGRVIDEVVA